MFSVVFMSGIAEHLMLQYTDNQYPFKSIWHSRVFSPATEQNGDIAQVHVSPAVSRQERKQHHVETDSGFPSAVPRCPAPVAKVGIDCRKKSIHHPLNESASMSSSASPAVLVVKYILDWEVLQFMIDTNHSKIISSEVLAYKELTSRLHLRHKPG